MAAIYKTTKSVFAYDFIDSIVTIYDRNALFDVFPGNVSVNVFLAVWFGVAIAIWVWADRKDSNQMIIVC